LKQSLKYIPLILGVSFLLACNENSLDVDVSDIEADVRICQFEKSLFQLDTNSWGSEFSELITEFPPFFEETNNPEIWKLRLQDQDLVKLYTQVGLNDSLFLLGLSGIEDGLKHYSYYFPDQEIGTIYTYVSGLDLDYPIIFADTMLFVAADLYLGKGHEAYESVPEYIQEGYQPKYVLKDVFREISRFHIPNNPTDKTFLNRMIYEGKRMYFLDAMMPNHADNLKIGFSTEHINWAIENEAYIWSYMINNKLLFSQDQSVVARFVEPAPFTKFYADVDPLTPGRLGIWLGWQIVRAYMKKHSEMSLIELINTVNSQEILNQSNYKPKK
jgi:hypothetical protein